jgi:hypothetical protein
VLEHNTGSASETRQGCAVANGGTARSCRSSGWHGLGFTQSSGWPQTLCYRISVSESTFGSVYAASRRPWLGMAGVRNLPHRLRTGHPFRTSPTSPPARASIHPCRRPQQA